MLDRIITYSFYALFFLTPLFWNSSNYELFEYNKMMLTYGITVVIIGVWILKMINQKSLIFNRTPMDIPLLLFLGANILSTVFSMDPHTSIWGYYSRSNGGLLSLISYLSLYWAFVSNMRLPQVKNILKFALVAGFLISLWAILEHFGVSFSCILLRGEFNDSCWIQDVQARVFATLGQPNWLAAYLAMLIFPAFYFLLTSTKKSALFTYYFLLVTLYLAFTFTYSRGPTLGLIGGMAIFLLLSYRRITKSIIVILISFLFINILFGSALTNFRLVSKFAAPSRPSIALPTSGTQLENGGTESGQIRLIVWQGAIDIFKHNPTIGSGLETFAYSYYQYRPQSHNLTSEWDFLYNKAHNEYLNYLATTGIVGFITYTGVILTFVIWCLKKLLESGHKNLESRILILVTLSAYISYLIYNFFLFSVVIIAVFFYIFPALTFVANNATSTFHLPTSKLNLLFSIIYRRNIYTKIAKGIVILSILYLLFSIFKLWYADTIFNQGQRASEAGNPGKAYNLLSVAATLNNTEPFYLSELGYAASAASAALKQEDATLSAQLKDEAIAQTDKAFQISPNNVSFWRTAVRTYFELTTVDKKYMDDTLNTLNKAITLAPTDPKLFYNKALVLDSMNKKDEELKVLQQALKLKPDYQEALAQLKEATSSAK